MCCTVFLCFTHESTSTKAYVSVLLGLGERPGHSAHQIWHQKVRQRGRQTWYHKRAPKSAPINVLTNQIQPAKTRFLRGAKDERRRHGSQTSRTPWSALFGRDTETTFESIFGNIFRRIFRPTFRCTFGRTFRRIVRRACGRINRKDQPTGNKQETTRR